jgi:tryptophan 7-halogenase
MINSIVIVGGGTSGWLSAASIVHKIKNVKVTLIDKELTDSVGVGEATLIRFDEFLEEYCGFKREDWFLKLETAMKAGILFPEWGGSDNLVWHPFSFPTVEGDIPVCDIWSNAQEFSLMNSLLPLYDISLQNSIELDDLGSYAYHINCKKLVEFIKEKIENKITTINSEVVDIIRDNCNNIKTLKLKNGIEVHGDLFLDCTGFKSILKNKRERVDLSDRLFCDTAIAAHVPYIDRKDELHPYVISHAVDHGWVWNIPLQTRIGTGLVFNRSITDIDDAKEYFVKYWENRIDINSLKVIDWTPYYDKNIWENNVVSIGLSAGFIEPLESTGVALICAGIIELIIFVQSKYYDSHDIDLYNSYMKGLFEQCIDYVNMHYSVTDKDTPFWNYVKTNFKMSNLQKFYLQNMDSEDPSIMDSKPGIFGGTNWIYWLIQLGYKIKEKTFISKDESRRLLINYSKSLNCNLKLVEHIEFLEKFK